MPEQAAYRAVWAGKGRTCGQAALMNLDYLPVERWTTMPA